MLFDESFTPKSAPGGPQPKEDFPSGLYSDGPPPPDQEALDQAIEEEEAAQPGPVPAAEEVEDETTGQTLREIEADDARAADEETRKRYPDINKG